MLLVSYSKGAVELDATFNYNLLLAKMILIALFIYTMILAFGVKKSVKEHKEEMSYTESIKKALSVLSEIKTDIKGEDEKMTEINTTEVEVKNKMSLTDLVDRKPSLHDYAEVVELLSKLARNRFENYQFYLAKAPTESDANFMSIVSNWHDDPELHKLIFAKGVEYGINMGSLQKYFVDHVRDGHVLDLGNDVMIITDDGSNLAPTGVSPITSGLEGGEISFNFTFIKKENYHAWCKETFEGDAEKQDGKTEDAKIQLVVNNG
ncbi:hypothetical protein FP73_gp054 [Bacillus phage Hoody T]|uniref:Uncharacterized protein n=1 Tax=Bacillus phage Hoody T TaxID=1486660 RepID=A0A024B2F9_9CAUD|nr:hypothetical protein FP73_gp054 [Bacillus phage Hoody T]AHZ10366.1 hypothetical protein [Bacillus phage Hoody T]